MAKEPKEVKGSLLDRIKAASTIKETTTLDKTKIFREQNIVPLPIPMMNVAFSGELDGGLVSGLTQICGPSKHFKTGFLLLMIKAYLDQYQDAIVLFYINEFGTAGTKYFDAYDIPHDRVVITPFLDIEQLKFDITTQLHSFQRGDHVFIAVDSVGNAASKKEVDDALEGNQAADMTRAKQIKSLFRIATPHLTLKDIPMVVINHVYKTQEMYSKDVVSGGTGIYLSSDNIFIIGRQQETEGIGSSKELKGYNFILKTEKSRYVKEQSKIPIFVSFEGGISKWSGLLENALESGHVIKPSNGWYQRVGEERKYREDDTNSEQFWIPILKDQMFKNFIRNKYKLSETKLLGDSNEKPIEDVPEDVMQDGIS